MSHSATLVVIDIGSSSIRASLVVSDTTILREFHDTFFVTSRGTSEVEFDAWDLAQRTEALIGQVLRIEGHSPIGIAITNQRASGVAWDRDTLRPIGPGISWQDVRTTGRCLALKFAGIEFSPSESATKFEYLGAEVANQDRKRLRYGTLDTWITTYLSRGNLFQSDASNAAMTGLTNEAVTAWEPARLEAVGISEEQLPTITVTHGSLGTISIFGHHLSLFASIGDQQASLAGQGIHSNETAKCTLGTGGMIDILYGHKRPPFPRQGPNGGFPVVALRDSSHTTWAVEGAVLSAGSAVAWFCQTFLGAQAPSVTSDLALEANPADQAIFVPALGGLGTPEWDFGARGAFFNLSKSTTTTELAAALLRGIAHRVADIIDALSKDASVSVSAIRLDGKMSQNHYLVQALANACSLPVWVSSQVESTTVGAAIIGFIGAGVINSLEQAASYYRHSSVAQPQLVSTDLQYQRARANWLSAVHATKGHLPALSALRF